MENVLSLLDDLQGSQCATKTKRVKFQEIPDDYSEYTESEILSILFTNKSRIEESFGQYQPALLDATKAISCDPSNVSAYMQRTNIYLSLNNYRGACEDLATAIRINPSDKKLQMKYDNARKQIDRSNLLESIKNQTTGVRMMAPPAKMPVKVIRQDLSQIKIDFDNFTEKTAIEIMLELKSGKMLSQDIVKVMIEKIRQIHEFLPNIVDIAATKPDAEIKVVGDTHGQFQDLIYIFDTFGNPSPENPYLFNGDYVDRGSQGLEILLVLFSWKIANPECIYLNRGNHETDLMNGPYGFETECSSKLNTDFFKNFSNVFGYLPIGHIIGNKVFVVHGGLFSDETVTVDDLQNYPRIGQPPDHGPMNDILWSDPMDQLGHAPSPRGVTSTFGPDVTERFLKANNLELLIRSHQVQDEGYLIQHNGKCITVFSAPNYIGRMGNKGAVCILTFNEDNSLNPPRFVQFSAQPIPPNFRPMQYTCFSSYF